ncbi:type II secretion system protein N, partial [Streptomyces brasiliscabiei]
NPPLPTSYNTATNNQSERVNSKSIIDLHLFGKADAVVKNNPSRQEKVINNAPETRLSINLTGIVAVSDNDQTGLAVIESQGQQATYLV